MLRVINAFFSVSINIGKKTMKYNSFDISQSSKSTGNLYVPISPEIMML